MLGCQGSFCSQVVQKEKKSCLFTLPYKNKRVYKSGRIKHATDMFKSLRPSQKVQKTTMQNTVFQLIFSTRNPWTIFFTLPLPLHFQVHSSDGCQLKYRKWFSKVVSVFKHFNASVFSRKPRQASTETAPTRENLLCSTFQHSWTPLPRCPTTTTAHSRDWKQRFQSWLVTPIFQEWTDQQQQWHEITGRETL